MDGATKRRLSLEDLTADPPIAGQPASDLQWRPGGGSFSYVIAQGSEENAPAELWIEDARSGRRTLAASVEALRIPADPSAAEVAPGVARQPESPRRISPGGYRWSPDGRRILLTGEDGLWLLDPGAARPERITRSEKGDEFPTFSPDGKRIAFVRKNDLYVFDLATHRETRLTSDGTDRVFNGRLDWVYEEELADRSGRSYRWSPDSASIAYLKLDDSPVEPSPIQNFLEVPAKIQWQFYPKAGGKNPVPSLHVLTLDGRERTVARVGTDEYILPAFSFTADSATVCYGLVNRAQTREELRIRNLSTGAERTLLVEEDPHWVNDDAVEPPRFFKDGRFLWKSERDGFAHLYLGDLAGGVPRQITRGDWIVDQLVGVDESRGLVYFTSTRDSPRRREIDRVSLDGTGLVRLTSGRGTHSAELSPDGQLLLDTFSTREDPPTVSVLDGAGRVIHAASLPRSRLAEYDLARTEDVEVTGDDGARLLARVMKPPDFDPSRRYPVIVFVYGGPHAQVVRDLWTASLLDHYLASRGYLVWSLDNRGSWGRGHAWESAIFRSMGARELADQLAGVRYLKSLPYVDPSRVGIWGWSYGGYMTLYALTRAPDVWKCGVAGAPVTHWKFYDTIYTERYMKTPAENPKGYEDSAPLSRAGDLRATLLLIHGAADDNVHLQNTVAFVDALVKAGRPYELQIQAGQKHGFRGKSALDFRSAAIARFFEKNL